MAAWIFYIITSNISIEPFQSALEHGAWRMDFGVLESCINFRQSERAHNEHTTAGGSGGGSSHLLDTPIACTPNLEH